MATKSSYQEQLRDWHWLCRREQIVKRDSRKCRECDKPTELNVHHRYYYLDRNVWEYPDEALVTFCEGCHNNYHGNIDAIKRMLGELSSRSLEQLMVTVKALIREDGRDRKEVEQSYIDAGEMIPVPIQYDAETLIDIMAEIRNSPHHSKR
jgi:arabinogalactan endo-1,4-beta-galactosidase